jgi:outer membrane protein assembly factor BamB
MMNNMRYLRSQSVVSLLIVTVVFAATLVACTSHSSASSASSTKSTIASAPSPRYLALIDTKTGEIDTDFADVNLGGDVGSVVSDRKGGWYIGGGFVRIGNEPRNGLAHLRHDGTLDPEFVPELPKGEGVNVILAHGGVIYAGGGHVYALDARSGRRLWRTSIGGDNVLGLAYRGGALYVSGVFSRVGGVARNGIAALAAVGGKPTSWHVDLSVSGGGPVTIGPMAVANSVLYFSGDFTAVEGVRRSGLAAVRLRTARPTAWAPKAGVVAGTFESIDSIFVTHGQVLVGSTFGGFAAFDARTARVLPWTKRLMGSAYAFAPSGNTVYLGAVADAGFTRAGGRSANNLASVVLPKGKFTNWRPNLGRCTIVHAMAVSGHEVLVGGQFSQVDCSG